MGKASQQPECRNVETLAQAGDTFQDFVDTIWRLRQPDGCPWDRKQTHASIAKNMIEEAYEAVDCIEANDSVHLCEELGDVLMQVVLHAQIARDAEEFSIDDVVRGVNEKLIRRHPHVFGEADAKNSDEVLAIWDKIKLKEKAARDASAEREDERPEGLLDGVPTSLPALMQAQKISKKLLPWALSGKASRTCGIRLPRSAPSSRPRSRGRMHVQWSLATYSLPS